jgi:molybdenum-dependent DNA-binding transcriptional regulator ModE
VRTAARRLPGGELTEVGRAIIEVEREFAEESSPILAAAEGEAEARALAEVEKDAERNEKPSRRRRNSW